MRPVIRLFVAYPLFMAALACCVTCCAQDLLSDKDYDKQTSSGIVIVEFWVDWNKQNAPIWLEELFDCDVYRVDIGKHPALVGKNSVAAVPTVILYSDGVEEKRFSPNIMFQLAATKEGVQGEIDEILLNQF